SEAELALLPRIGPSTAKRIVDYREKNGEFERATDLMQVKGIGEKSFELIRGHLVVEGQTTLSTKLKAPRTSKKSASQPSSAAQ
ncbi:MAG TPA: helix-hairpin-helix domain-containing protein, partial [Thermoanaerobaculia bacterium]|nr:helix-hairpin-helix domain-containing protein [Thermoanaerobaculia bacterium]